MFIYNTIPHTATGYTSFEFMYGHRASLPTALTAQSKPYYTYDNYAQELKRLRATQKLAKKHIREAKQKAKYYADKNTNTKTFRVRDKVLLHDEARRGRSKILEASWSIPNNRKNFICEL
ncbi:hypothetical protein P5V15_002522 [Pogonomyrmex californicus]